MNFIIDNWYLFVLAIVSGGMLLVPMLQRGAGGISPSQAVLMINREKAIVVDVRSEQEFAAGHITGARHVPLEQLQERLPALVKNKALPVLFVCAKGNRALRGAVVARSQGYEKAQIIAGGMKAWNDAGLPLDKPKAAAAKA